MFAQAIRSLVLWNALAAMAVTVPVAHAGKKPKGEVLSGDQILALISNREVHWDITKYIPGRGKWRDFTVSVRYESPPGQTRGRMTGRNLTTGTADEGQWWLNDEGRFCRKWNQWADGEEACRVFTRDRKGRLRSYQRKDNGSHALIAAGSIRD